jgi:hypothetical protein
MPLLVVRLLRATDEGIERVPKLLARAALDQGYDEMHGEGIDQRYREIGRKVILPAAMLPGGHPGHYALT